MSNQRRLGRGLEALLGRSLDDPSTEDMPLENDYIKDAPASDAAMHSNMDRDYNGQLWLDVVSIDTNPHQPRKEFDEVEIADLADSIRTHGVIQPLVVRQSGDRFELIAGERRLRAAQAAGWERVPVQVRDVTDQQMAEVAIVENVQRKDLNALEKAACFQKYLQDYSCTQEELAARIHIDRSTIANLIRLLELPEQVKKLVVKGDISQGHAPRATSTGRRRTADRLCLPHQSRVDVSPRDRAGGAGSVARHERGRAGDGWCRWQYNTPT